MAELRFGTDGVRGRAFDELTLDLAARLGRSACEVFGGADFVVGMDTRESGPAVRDALATGVAAAGGAVLDLGVAPTPAVAWVGASRGLPAAVISASHNAWHDNGIKFFGPDGSKLTDDEQTAIEASLSKPMGAALPEPAVSSIQPDIGGWTSAVASTASADFDGMTIVIDAANGAASHIAGPLFADLGAQVHALAISPDGRNINDACGSTHPAMLGEAVIARGADLGVAFDGDADRLVCVDATGAVIGGDHLMAILAEDLRGRHMLADDTVVVTVMSNLGFHRAMAERSIAVDVTQVGDRHILESLARNGWSFGGEQSGHLIFADLATTGDGLLSAVQVLGALSRSDADLTTLAAEAMTSLPQVLRNVALRERVADPAAVIADEIAAVEAELGNDGRVLIRASGTEPVVRVMVEAVDQHDADRYTTRLCEALVDRIGD